VVDGTIEEIWGRLAWGDAQIGYPSVNFQIEGKGSNTAPGALTAGTSHFAPMSRSMKEAEIDGFEARFGYKPTEIRVAVDALAVFVHADNPIKSLPLEQVDGMFRRLQGGRQRTEWLCLRGAECLEGQIRHRL